MNRSSIILLLSLIVLGSVGYAIYRSTGVEITLVENGKQTVYGQPAHGLTLGLCAFAGFCVLAIAYLFERSTNPPKDRLTAQERDVLSKRTL